MNYYFRGFQFKSDQLVLIKMEQTVKIRANEAKLLTLLLSDPQCVFSKEQILENVWAGKSVAEQSIFQNISNLRNIFGDDAITTHPKKGYQWQIPLELPPEKKTANLPYKTNQWFKYSNLLVSFAILIYIATLFLKPQTLTTDLPVIALIPIEVNSSQNAEVINDEGKSYNQILVDALSKKEAFSVILSKNGKSFNALKASPSLLVPVEKKNEHADLILSTKVKKHHSELFITFNLLTENNFWQGVINANSLDKAADKLAKHINIIIAANVLLTHKDNLKRVHAKLQLMHDNSPNDLIVLHHYIKSALRIGLLNEAVLLTDQLVTLARKTANQKYLAEAYMLNTDIMIQQKNHSEAKIQLNKAASVFSDIDDIAGLTHVAGQKAFLLFNDDNYAAMKNTLLESIDLLKLEGAYFKSIEQLITLAAYANKFKKIVDRDYYLSAAKQLLDTHNFPKQHYSHIYFQQGFYAEMTGNDIEAEKYYRWVIELFTPDQEWWSKERAQYHLSLLLLKNNRIPEAVALFKNEGKLTVKEKIILASVYQYWHKPQESITLAKQAYSEAVLTGELNASLNAALMLVELSTFDKTLAKETYIHYLRKGATPYWSEFAKSRLQKLTLYPL